MKIDIKSNQLELDKGIEIYINRKLKFALSRLEKNISSISINLSQTLNKLELYGGIKEAAKICCLKVTFYNLQTLEYEDTQTDLYCAIDRVIQKASRAMARRVFSTGISVAK